MNEKDQRLAAYCRANSIDGVILRRRSNIAWLTDGADTHIDLSSRLGVGTVVWTPSRKTVYADVIETPRFRDEEFTAALGRAGWEFVDYPWSEAEPPIKGRLVSDWPTDHIAELRWSLTTDEIATVRQLGREAAEVLCDAMQSFPRGVTEHGLAGTIVGELRERGIFAPVMLIASDERLQKYRHPIPTSKKIDRIVMAAICAERRGLVVSATRIVHFGAIPDDLRRRHTAVCRVDTAYHRASVPETRWCDALAAGLDVYKQTGFADEWLKHHQGGPMGYELREFKATPTETRTVQPRQLIGWNPSITGTKSEDTILTAESATGKAEIVTRAEWPMVDVEGWMRPDILERS